MNGSYQKLGLWFLLAGGIFAVFRWLFGLAMPEAAWQFALGMTVILTSGLLFGRYISRLWFRADHRLHNIVFACSTGLIILGCFLIGVFINKMIEQTEFMHFFFTVIILFLVTAAAAAIISLVRYRIRSRMRAAQNALSHSKSELQVLQSQLSPHFLFNTLNNLYGLSITDHTKVPGLLLKLSELLRYSVYEAKELFVPLNDEVNYLKNYIEFERIRLGDRLNLKLNLEDVGDTAWKIAPMLLIVFVENAFKHSRDTPEDQIFIDISLRLAENRVVFDIKNSLYRSGLKSPLTAKHSGFGLESVRKRLNFLYENAHEMKIMESEREYEVSLILAGK